MTYDLLKKQKKQENYLEVTFNEKKDHIQTISNLMENSWIKKEQEKSNKIGILAKIQKKLQKTKETMKKILHKTPDPKTIKTASVNILNFASPNLEKENLNLEHLPENNKLEENDENEELALSRKKVSIYLNNKKIGCEGSLIIRNNEIESEEYVISEGSENINEEGMCELKKLALENNIVNKNHLELKFSNVVAFNHPLNSNEKINEIKDSCSFVNGEKITDREILSLKKSENSPEFEIPRSKKKDFTKSFSINLDQIKHLKKMISHEIPGRFSLGNYFMLLIS